MKITTMQDELREEYDLKAIAFSGLFIGNAIVIIID
jgi:hypothetical protein